MLHGKRGDLLLTVAEEVGFQGTIHAARNGWVPKDAVLLCLENSRSFPHDSPIGAGAILRVGDRISVFTPEITNRLTEVFWFVTKLDASFRWQRKLMPGGNILTLLCMAPLVIPGIVLGIGFYAAFASPPVALYGTAAILILGYSTRFLPIAYVNCAASLRSLNPEMEEAVRILGGSRLRAIARVIVPMLKKSLLGTWLLVFIPATRELSTAIFLVGAQTRVISVMMLDLSENGSFEILAALGFFLLGATILIVLIGYKIIGRDFMLRRS